MHMITTHSTKPIQYAAIMPSYTILMCVYAHNAPKKCS